jgi:type I restriction enzyme M protein
MAIKKSELYSSLWASCDELRGGMDASQYKDYVLFMLFIKYVSDKYGDYDGFEPPVVIPKGASFRDMVALTGDSDIGNKINTQVIQPLIDANSRLARSDFPDFNDSNKLGDGAAKVEKLGNLIAIFENPALDFSKNRAENDDILGDAYEYLMRHFASQSGKSKGQFYTPSEVSRIMAKVIGISPANSKASTTAYDPTCGSGSLLLKVAAEAGKHITLEGQEKDVTTAGLARMNMILHDFPTANVLSGNTLFDPKFKDGEQLRTYDYVVANPPFSDKTWSTGLTLGEGGSGDKFQRFTWGVPPKKQGDYAYLLHIIRSMKSTGKAACILPHGVLFRGNAEALIRRQLIRSGYLKAIIGLPANLFYGTGIPACIVVLDKENATARKGVFMIDASKGFKKDGPKNRLREQDIHKIVDTFTRQDESDPRYARMVPVEEIADPKNHYNLNLPRYIDSTAPEDLQDIDGHLRGGIPERDIDAFAADWQQFPGVRAVLFESAGRPGYIRLKLPIAEVKQSIFSHPEFADFQKKVTKLFRKWRKGFTPCLTGFGKDDHPKALIETISESLLLALQAAPLLDAYDVYQHLMDYWAETMQDDCYLIADAGWKTGAQPREIIQVQNKEKRLVWPEPHDYKVGSRRFKSDLIPATMLIARYFTAERDAITVLEANLADIERQLEELTEEHSGDDGILRDVDSKAEAEAARTESVVALWQDVDSPSWATYTALKAAAADHKSRLTVLSENHHFSAVRNGKRKLTLKAITDRLKNMPTGAEHDTLTAYVNTDKSAKEAEKKAGLLFAVIEPQFLARLSEDPLPDELRDLDVVVRYLSNLDKQADAKARLKAAQEDLEAKLDAKYPTLTEDEIKTLVVDDKWLATIAAAVQGELDRVSQTLTGRIRQLAERYDTPLPQLTDEVATLAIRVDGHLQKMGAVWK